MSHRCLITSFDLSYGTLWSVHLDLDLLTNKVRAHDDRFYPLFGQLANIAPICAGQTVAFFARRSDTSDDSFGVALQGTTCLILAAGVCLMGLYANIQVSSSVCERGTRAVVYFCADTALIPEFPPTPIHFTRGNVLVCL